LSPGEWRYSSSALTLRDGVHLFDMAAVRPHKLVEEPIFIRVNLAHASSTSHRARASGTSTLMMCPGPALAWTGAG
jgi:hypothetical protein